MNEEQKVAKTLLQDYDVVRVGRHKYKVRPMNLATLIRMSGHIADMPDDMDKDDAVRSLLKNAKDLKPMAEAFALCLVCEDGRGGVRGIVRRMKYRRAVKDVMLCGGAEIRTLYNILIESIDVADFFVITTFLGGVNMTKPTKVV